MKTSLILLSFFLLSSCMKDIETDAAKYCECKEREYKNEAKAGECATFLHSLKTKYEYFPEEQDALVLKIADCMGEIPIED